MAKKIKRATNDKPDVILSLGEVSFAEEGYYADKWDDAKLPANAIELGKGLEKRLSSVQTIAELLVRNEIHKTDADDNELVHYEALTPAQEQGLRTALRLLMEQSQDTLEMLREACGGR